MPAGKSCKESQSWQPIKFLEIAIWYMVRKKNNLWGYTVSKQTRVE